jgi:catechol 2,3-dioxygenase-like lactoylglutathione lyase family enzyme
MRDWSFTVMDRTTDRNVTSRSVVTHPVAVWSLDSIDTAPRHILVILDDPSQRGDMPITSDTVNVRYIVDDVDAAVAFYTTHLGFEVNLHAAPAFADVIRGNLRLLLSGPTSSAGRAMPDGTEPTPGGWNRIHLIVDDLASEVDRLQAEGVPFRNDIVAGPGGRQILLCDPAGNLVELFQPAG